LFVFIYVTSSCSFIVQHILLFKKFDLYNIYLNINMDILINGQPASEAQMEQILGMIESFMGGRETRNIETKSTMATYYAPLFPREQRTPELLKAFEECFGDDSSICNLPRPLLCAECIDKYIENCDNLVIENNNDIVTSSSVASAMYKDVISPRLEILRDQFDMLMEHFRSTNDDINPDTVFEFLGINMDPYDPASTTVLEQCPITTYISTDEHIDTTCSICICDFEENEPIRTLICKHAFHTQCIAQWLSDHSTCPICKASLK
jgi:hypothetical protein